MTGWGRGPANEDKHGAFRVVQRPRRNGRGREDTCRAKEAKRVWVAIPNPSARRVAKALTQSRRRAVKPRLFSNSGSLIVLAGLRVGGCRGKRRARQAIETRVTEWNAGRKEESVPVLAVTQRGPTSILICGTPMGLDAAFPEILPRRERNAER